MYIPREMEILSSIQDASMRTTLPIIIAIFKHLSNYNGLVDKNEIKISILNDKDLELSSAGSKFRVDEISLENSINVLIFQNIFLASEGNKIGLTERGKQAVMLLGLVE
jgi:hypothetical protein